MKTSLALVVALFATSIARSSLAGLPEDPGSFATESTTFDIPVAAGVNLSADVYLPKTSGARPLVILRHGYTSHKPNMVGWAEHLATHGFVGVSFESRDANTDDSAVDGEDMVKLTEWLVARSTDNTSSLFGRIDAQRIAVGGHSAGGGAATVAAASLSPQVLVLLDSEDTAPALAVANTISAPTVALFAEASGCNENGDNRTTFASVSGPRFGAFVPGATHCDGEDPIDVAGCGYYCGDPTTPHHAEFKRYTTAFLEAYLLCDSAAYPYVDGAQAKSDPAITILPQTAKLKLPPPGCATSPGADGGGPNTDGGGPNTDDGGATGPGGTDPDAGPGKGDASAGVSPTDSAGDGGGSCSILGGSNDPTWLVVFAPAAVVLLLRYRRRHRR